MQNEQIDEQMSSDRDQSEEQCEQIEEFMVSEENTDGTGPPNKRRRGKAVHYEQTHEYNLCKPKFG